MSQWPWWIMFPLFAMVVWAVRGGHFALGQEAGGAEPPAREWLQQSRE